MEMRAPSLCSSQLVCDLLPGWHACHVSQSAAQCARALCFDLIERCCQWSIASRLEADRPGPSLRQALCCRSRVAIDWRAASTCRLRSWTMLIIRWRVLLLHAVSNIHSEAKEGKVLPVLDSCASRLHSLSLSLSLSPSLRPVRVK